MGKHYVPRQYLRGFCDPAEPETITQFNRRKGVFNRPAVGKAAQEPDFYDPDVEKKLTDYVENPANPVLAKLRKGEGIDSRERSALTDYIATMLHRVPHNRMLFIRHAPDLFAETVSDVKRKITQMAEAGVITREQGKIRFQEADQIYAQHRDNPAHLAMARVREPWPSLRVCQAIHEMTWRLLTPKGSIEFITSDNPVFFFECYGLATPNSEMSFPLSPTLLLHGCFDGGFQYEKIGITDHMAKEFNRRTFSRSTQMLFSRKVEEWIRTMGSGNPAHVHLSRINWVVKKPKWMSPGNRR